ncbi:DUF732 domain-containing protein [Streptomyces sp. RKAG293]|uniref:DUF732 domain-containing protein n=1 Tax=Streptomyces sp. RKAG293 TaxID=2893403 RepID=UPI0020343101|nr:DUF732 domain-containing protein [Streptomyces sp. RKAG293]MCM2420295.1 DUF732 domain-containing protein [Streptomyces sp. RKAG293]
MHRRITIAISAVVITAAGLTACSSSSDANAPAKTTAPATTTAAPSALPDKATTAPADNTGIPAKPNAATQAKYLAALDAISTKIVNGKPDRAVSRGRDTCGTIHSFPKDHAKQVETTRVRFSGATEFTTAQAEKILKAVHTNLCPKN